MYNISIRTSHVHKFRFYRFVITQESFSCSDCIASQASPHYLLNPCTPSNGERDRELRSQDAGLVCKRTVKKEGNSVLSLDLGTALGTVLHAAVWGST